MVQPDLPSSSSSSSSSSTIPPSEVLPEQPASLLQKDDTEAPTNHPKNEVEEPVNVNDTEVSSTSESVPLPSPQTTASTNKINNKRYGDEDSVGHDPISMPSSLSSSGRDRHRQGRFVLRTMAIALFAIAMLAIAVPIWTRSSGNNERLETTRTTPFNNEDENNTANDDDNDDEEVISNDESLSALSSSSPVQQQVLLLCTEVSYQLNKLSVTAEEVLRQEGNTTFQDGLEIAASLVAEEFVESTYGYPVGTATAVPTTTKAWVAPLRAYATVTAVVDLPAALCTKPNCLVVTQHVCLRLNYEPEEEEEEEEENEREDHAGEESFETVRDGLRQALREAITSGQLIQKVPPQYLPPP